MKKKYRKLGEMIERSNKVGFKIVMLILSRKRKNTGYVDNKSRNKSKGWKSK